jgi:formylglycine-generating enzyme required for sulfatase activity
MDLRLKWYIMTFVTAFLIVSSILFSESIVYKTGESMDGKLMGAIDQNLVFDTTLGRIFVPIQQVDFVIYNKIVNPEKGFISISGIKISGYVENINDGYVTVVTNFGKMKIKLSNDIDYLSFSKVDLQIPSQVSTFTVELTTSDNYAVFLSSGEMVTGMKLSENEGYLTLIDKYGNELQIRRDFVETVFIPVVKAIGYDLLILKDGRKIYGKVTTKNNQIYEISAEWGKLTISVSEVVFTTYRPDKTTQSLQQFTQEVQKLNNLIYDKDSIATMVVKNPLKVDGKEVRVVKVYPQEVVDPRTGVVFVFVPGGIFKMGAEKDWDKVEEDELPSRNVYVSGFYISKYPITVKQYIDFLRAAQVSNVAIGNNILPVQINFLGSQFNVSYKAQSDVLNLPITGISWNSAKAYCDWAGYQLPTEAQWEKAARGTDGRMYPWGNTFQNKYNDGKKNYDVKAFETTDVSPYGVVNMYGYPVEYCRDFYDKDAYKKLPAENPVSTSGNLVVGRVGALSGRITDKIAVAPSEIRNDFTFRVVINADNIFTLFDKPTNNKLMGVTWFVVNEKVKTQYNIKNEGMYIAFVEEGSPAQLAGIKIGDVVISIDKKPVKTQDDIVKSISGKKIGDEVTVTVNRSGKIIDLKVNLGIWKLY